MLGKLALKHDQWVRMARGICKDSYLADDLVSEMYLKFADYTKEINDYYVYFAIKHLHINYIREEKKRGEVELSDNLPVFYESETRRPDVVLPDTISWVEKQILLLRQQQSGRDIGKQYKIHYTKVHRIEQGAKAKLTEWAKEIYRERAI